MEKLLNCCYDPPTMDYIMDCCKQEHLNIGKKLSRRQYLRKQHELPTIAEMNQSLGPCLGDIIRKQANPVVRQCAKIDKPLKGPQKPLWVPPKSTDIVLTKPPDEDNMKALHHQFILDMGHDIEDKFENEIKKRVINDFIIREREFHLFECQKKREFLKEKERLRCEEICIKLENTLLEQFELEKIELYKNFERCRRTLAEFLIQKCDMEAQEMVSNAIYITKAYMNVLFLEQLNRDTTAFEKKTEERLEKQLLEQEEAYKKRIEQLAKENDEALTKQKHFLQCRNITEIMHTICAEKADAHHKIRIVKNKYEDDIKKVKIDVLEQCKREMKEEAKDADIVLRHKWNEVLTDVLKQQGNPCFTYDKTFKKIEAIFKSITQTQDKMNDFDPCGTMKYGGPSKIFVIGTECLSSDNHVQETNSVCLEDKSDFDDLDKKTYQHAKDCHERKSTKHNYYEPTPSKIDVRWGCTVEETVKSEEEMVGEPSFAKSEDVERCASVQPIATGGRTKRTRSNAEILLHINNFLRRSDAGKIILKKILNTSSASLQDGLNSADNALDTFVQNEISKIVAQDVLGEEIEISSPECKPAQGSGCKIHGTNFLVKLNAVDSLELIDLPVIKGQKEEPEISNLLTTQDSLEIVRQRLSSECGIKRSCCPNFIRNRKQDVQPMPAYMNLNSFSSNEIYAKTTQDELLCSLKGTCDDLFKRGHKKHRDIEIQEGVVDADSVYLSSRNSSEEVLLSAELPRRSIIKHESVSSYGKKSISLRSNEDDALNDVFKTNKMRSLLNILMKDKSMEKIIMKQPKPKQ